jgi:tetratricopeptide (TPR) repeat protein
VGVVRAARGDWAGAERAFREALVHRPGWATALRNLGDARLAGGDLEGALAAYEHARRAGPFDAATANNLAWALLQHPSRWPEAEPLVAEALAGAGPGRGFYLDTLGLLRLRQRAAGDALAAFREALADQALDGATRARVLQHAAEALEALGDPGGAARCRGLAEEAARPGGGSLGPGDTVC